MTELKKFIIFNLCLCQQYYFCVRGHIEFLALVNSHSNSRAYIQGQVVFAFPFPSRFSFSASHLHLDWEGGEHTTALDGPCLAEWENADKDVSSCAVSAIGARSNASKLTFNVLGDGRIAFLISFGIVKNFWALTHLATLDDN